jgi:crossover junction endodeoxyribonuclease RuvC
MHHVAHGTIFPPKTIAFEKRLQFLYTGLTNVLRLYAPEEAAVEETFVNNNPTSTLKLGMARGVVLLSPAEQGIKVSEYSANRVKKTVVGVGHATKDQVLLMIQRILPMSQCKDSDAADALAVAICHSHFRETQQKWGILS